jgi:hypothetical protein
MEYKFHNNTDRGVSFGGVFNPAITIPKFKAMIFTVSDNAPLAVYSKMGTYKKVYNTYGSFIKNMFEIYNMLKSTIGRVGFTVSSGDFEAAKFITIDKDSYKNIMTVGESQEIKVETNLTNPKLASTNKEIVRIAKNNSMKIIAESVGECDIYAGNNTVNDKIHITVINKPEETTKE